MTFSKIKLLMSTEKPKSLTIEEAVALMVNVESLPRNNSLNQYLGELHEDAEIEHYEAKRKGAEEHQVELLERRRLVCMDRHSLAHHIHESLSHEVTNEIDDPKCLLKRSPDSSITLRLTAESVAKWALKTYGISILKRPLPPKSKRGYKSTFLDILDHAIEANWGTGNPKMLPKNESMEEWMVEQYPKVKISKKVLDAMCTIMRPDKYRSAREKQSMNKAK